jgi:F-type H+-transporting ATPase subunit b
MMASSNFLIPNGTFFVELLCFVIILAVVAKVGLPRLNVVLAERQERIRRELEAAERAQADAQAADQERRAVLEEARRQARELVAQANRTAEQVRADAHARGEEEYQHLVGSAEAEIELARQRAIAQASENLGAMVISVVEAIIGREVDHQAHRDLIDEAIAAVTSEGGGTAGEARSGAGSRS